MSETIADINAWLRRPTEGENAYLTLWRNEIADRIEAAEKREVEELRECMKEAIREKCPFTRMSCKHGETCDYECGTFKWRKALQDEGGADALFLKRNDKQC